MKRHLLLYFLISTNFFLGSSLLFGQDLTGSSMMVDQKDPRIDVLADRYNKTHKIRGYRVQIISSSKKDRAKKAKSKFASRYHSIQAQEIYQQPFFIIKVGNFLTKIEAEKFHQEIEGSFPGCFVLPDFIEPYKQYLLEDLN